MKAVELALLILCIQAGIGLVVVTGLFNNSMYFENTMTINLPDNMSAIDQNEQDQSTINVLNSVIDTLSWGWIKQFFQPWYSNNAGVTSLVDHLLFFLRTITGLIIGAAILEIFRNRTDVL